MNNYFRLVSLVAPTVLLAGYLTPTRVAGALIGDSADINQLLADTKAEAAELKADSENMNSFTNSNLTWQSYASQIELVKGHVNNAGQLLAKLRDAEGAGSAWQQTAIKRIEPLLKELAANTEITIKYLNENQNKVHFKEFGDYVKANYELSTNLEALISDFVNYGETKQEFESLGEKLEVNR
jgi:hypothetical protein